jgi:outer membrane protein assembly factor BamB
MFVVSLRRWMLAVAAGLALPAAGGTALAAVPAWTTYRHDAARSGIDPDSGSPVTPTQAWQSVALDGAIYGQPLIYQSRVYVATEDDTVYALDSATGAIVWQRHVATPVPSGQLPCGDISPTVGITSTPVIDPATGRIYVVADTWDGSNINHEMYALNLSDGSVGVGPIGVDPPGVDHAAALQRTSVALAAGKVIIGYGGNAGDCPTYYGWLVAAREDGTGGLQTFQVDHATGEGAIWASGNAPPVDSAGNIWTSTGNGSGGWDYQESVIKLDSNLNVLDHWTPSTWASLDSNDADIGSSMPLLLPGNLVFQIGKQGVGYLLNATSLGGGGSASGGTPVYSASVCSGSWGGAIYVNGVIYVTCSNGLHALSLNLSAKTFSALSGWAVNASVNGPPMYAGGLVWAVDWNGSTLYGLNPSTGATAASFNLNGFEHFTTPSAAGGLLFVANNDAVANGDDVTAIRIATTSPASQTSTSLSTSANPAGANQALTLTATVAPAPDAGTVAFTDGGQVISGCGAVPVSVTTGQASCAARFGSTGQHAIVGSYSGDAYYLASSGSLQQTIAQAPGGPNGTATPVISHLKVKVFHRQLRISLVLSTGAKLTVVVSKLVPGHMVHHRCRAGGRRGRRCRAAVRKATFARPGRSGRNSFAPRMRALPSGTYAVTVTAISPDGRRSKPRTAVIVVRLSRH